MDVEVSGRAWRARLHRALADESRLAIVEALALSDRTPGELRAVTGSDWNLLGFHLGVLEDAGVVARHVSRGDRRRRYVRLRPEALAHVRLPVAPPVRAPLFVCTGNAARSPFAAVLWRETTGWEAASAGADPAAALDPLAVEVAGAHGVDLSGCHPRGYAAVEEEPELMVSVCDRALEGGIPFSARRVHWSVPDPAAGDRATFEAAFADIAERVGRLAEASA
jgi:protein-tyrosine-phosphatase